MKSIFTYPSDSATNFIASAHVGDSTFGFTKRVNELRDGTYRAHANSTAKGTTANIMNAMSRFHNVPNFENDSGNNEMHLWWEQPLIEYIMRYKGPIVKDISVEVVTITHDGSDYKIPKLRVEYDRAHGLSTGDRLDNYGGNTTSAWNTITGQLYVTVINTTEVYLHKVQTPSNTPPVADDYVLDFLNDTQYDIATFGAIQSRVIRYDGGTGSHGALLKLQQSEGTVGLSDGATIRHLNGFSESHDTGTANSASTTFHLKSLGGSSFSWELYTDAGFTTPATLDEVYYAERTRTFTSAGTYTLENQSHTDWGITSPEESNLHTEQNGWCRIIATVTTGTFTGNDLSNETIPTSIQYTGEFYWESAGGQFDIYNKRGTDQLVQDFVLTDTGSGVNVTIEIKFINPARTGHGYTRFFENDTTDANMALDTHGQTATYEIGTANILMPGNKKYTFQNSSNVTTAGIQYAGNWYLEGGTASNTVGAGESMPNNNTINIDGNGYITGFTFPAGESADRGTFTSIATRYFVLSALADQYVAPTTYAEDVWDTDDEWTSNAFSLSKLWPDHVAPSGAKIITMQPSHVTRAQDGTKYVRSSGVITQRLEVVYPPMTYNDFREFEAVAQLAKGQTNPFYFRVKGIDAANHNILFFRTDTEKDAGLTSPFQMRLRTATTVGDKTILIEGFSSDRSNVFLKGEYLIFSSSGYSNGDLVQVVNDNIDSNVFGEAKIRLPYGVRVASNAGETTLFKNISHVIVSLSDDQFEYSVGTDGLYRVTVRFDFDEFK